MQYLSCIVERNKTVLFLIITEGKNPLSQNAIERGVKFSTATKKMLGDVKRAGKECPVVL